ncbi:MAG: cation:proton antiporter [Pseudomonadota bacterium]
MRLDAIFLTLGVFFLLGLLADEIGRRTVLPRVTILMLTGAGLGEAGLDMVPREIEGAYDFLAATALTMIAFLLGGGLTAERLSGSGSRILIVSACVVIASFAAVALGLLLAGLSLALALMLAAISTATDPAAVTDVIRQARARGPFVDLLKSTVAIDDAWGLIVFSLVLAILGGLGGGGAGQVLWDAARELGGALLVGLGIGLPAAMLTGRIRPGEPTRTEALGTVFLIAGLAGFFGASTLLAGIVTGAVIANLAQHHTRPFHEIERMEWPFLVLFFLLAGATIDASALRTAVLTLGLYVGLRTLGRLLGGWAGGTACGLSGRERLWLGPSLLPQAGVAVGMAIVGGEHFPEHREALVATAAASTVFFEMVGPIATRIALRKTAIPGPPEGENTRSRH